jgi:hypothetical protein
LSASINGAFFIQKLFSPDALAVKAREVLDQLTGPTANGYMVIQITY